MNDNASESERWLPVAGVADEPSIGSGLMRLKTDFGAAEQNAKSAYCSPALDRARREAEAVIAKAFSAATVRR